MAHPSNLKEMKEVKKSLRKAREELDQLMAEVEAHTTSQSQGRGQGGAEKGGSESQEVLHEVKTEGVEVPFHVVQEADTFEEVKPKPKTKKIKIQTPNAQEKPHKRKRGEDEQMASPPEQAVDPEPLPEEPKPKHVKKTTSKNAEKGSSNDARERKQNHKASCPDMTSGSSGRDQRKAVDIFKNVDFGGAAMSPDALRVHCQIIAEEYEKLFQQNRQMHLEMAHMRAELRGERSG